MKENASGSAMNCVSGFSVLLKSASTSPVATQIRVNRKAAVMPTGKPMASAVSERRATPCRRSTAATQRPASGPNSGPTTMAPTIRIGEPVKIPTDAIRQARTMGRQGYPRLASLRLGSVLTDYHLHLRPDEDGTPPERYFTTENVDRYLAAAADAGISELGVSEHVHRFVQALDLWRHPFWEEQARDDLDSYCAFVRETPLRLGIECDFVPGAEDRTAILLEARDFDYVVGSVHFVGERAVDHEGWDVWEGSGDPDEVWRRYFAALAGCATSGLFDILAHPDLVKVWGAARPMPERDPRFLYEPAVEAIAESGIAVEVSTAGLRKPAGEIYPSRAFAEMCVEAGAAFALSSDAHLPEQVGFAYDRAVEFLGELGVSEICVFEGRSRRLEPLGAAMRKDRAVRRET